MAKKKKSQPPLLNIETLLENKTYYEIYLELLKYKKTFENVDLFLLNCEASKILVLEKLQKTFPPDTSAHVLINSPKNTLALKAIIEDRSLYDHETSLTNFEFYLAKFVVAFLIERTTLYEYWHPHYIELVDTITISERDEHKYFPRTLIELSYSSQPCALKENENFMCSNQTENSPKLTWKGMKKNDLAYLFWKLEKEGLIGCQDLGKTLSLIVLGADLESIENTLFNTYFGKFRKRDFPTNATQIDAAVNILKVCLNNNG